ncbi:MAG: V-type ATP synthase subunit F [Oscillospiraceae bacterium]
MKYFLISDNVDTLAGMRLVGVRGIVAAEESEIRKAMDDAKADKSIGLVLVSEKLCIKYKDLFLDYKMNCPRPLIVEMPDRHTKDDVAQSIRRDIIEAVGIKI